MLVIVVFTPCSTGLFLRFGRTCCLHLQSDSLVQVDGEVIANSGCVGHVGGIEEILAIQSFGRGKRG